MPRPKLPLIVLSLSIALAAIIIGCQATALIPSQTVITTQPTTNPTGATVVVQPAAPVGIDWEKLISQGAALASVGFAIYQTIGKGAAKSASNPLLNALSTVANAAIAHPAVKDVAISALNAFAATSASNAAIVAQAKTGASLANTLLPGNNIVGGANSILNPDGTVTVKPTLPTTP